MYLNKLMIGIIEIKYLGYYIYESNNCDSVDIRRNCECLNETYDGNKGSPWTMKYYNSVFERLYFSQLQSLLPVLTSIMD